MNKKGQCGLRVGSSALHHPHGNESHKASSTSRCRVQFAFYLRGSKVKADFHLHIRGNCVEQADVGLSCAAP